MKTEAANLAQVNDTLEALRQELGRLSQRVAALEKKEAEATGGMAFPGRPIAADGLGSPSHDVATEEIPEEIVLVIGAAVAAFLGKRAPIRQIRLLGSAAWAQQGRVIIQASHHR